MQSRARLVDAGGYQLRLAAPNHLLVLKLAAAEESRLRPSKRRQDVLDIIAFAEEHPRPVPPCRSFESGSSDLGAHVLTLGT